MPANSMAIPSILAIDGRDDIELRLPLLKDAPELYKLLKKNKEYLEEFRHLQVVGITLEKIERSIKTTLKHIQEGERLQYRIIHDGDIVGSVMLYDIDQEVKTAVLGVWVAHEFQGKGYATSASKQLIKFSLDNLGISKVILEIHPKNVKSERVAEKLGAQLTDDTIMKEKIDNQEFSFRICEVEKI